MFALIYVFLAPTIEHWPCALCTDEKARAATPQIVPPASVRASGCIPVANPIDHSVCSAFSKKADETAQKTNEWCEDV